METVICLDERKEQAMDISVMNTEKPSSVGTVTQAIQEKNYAKSKSDPLKAKYPFALLFKFVLGLFNLDVQSSLPSPPSPLPFHFPPQFSCSVIVAPSFQRIVTALRMQSFALGCVSCTSEMTHSPNHRRSSKFYPVRTTLYTTTPPPPPPPPLPTHSTIPIKPHLQTEVVYHSEPVRRLQRR